MDDIKKTEITMRGMGNVSLNRQRTKKTEVEHNKMDEYEQKRAARQQISMPDKPATYKKPKKPSPPKKEESPPCALEPLPKPEPPKETPEPPKETPKPKKKTNFVFVTKPPTPPHEPTPPPPKEPTPSPPMSPTPPPPPKSPITPREKTPDLQTRFWPTPKLPSPEPVTDSEEVDLIQLEPAKPLKVGINGFDRIGRLAFRTALETGLEITAINDPFIPLHYMVYSLKFDSAHCKVRRKELTVKESSDGNLIVNDKQITVFKEVEPRKIPWDSVGVNYVIEATESLQSRVNALHHLEHDTSGINTMEKLVNKKDAPAELDGDCSDAKPVISILDNHISKSNVSRVIVASNSTEFPSFGIGINDDRISKTSKVICSISAQGKN